MRKLLTVITVSGRTGAPGATGKRGLIGATGPWGKMGATGRHGPNGEWGSTGRTGATGQRGSDGRIGSTGSRGARGMQGLQGKFQSCDIHVTSYVNVNASVMSALGSMPGSSRFINTYIDSHTYVRTYVHMQPSHANTRMQHAH